jgi:dihydropteroate synthase
MYSPKDFKDTFFYRKKTSSARGKLIDWSKPMVMGILNVTPDSFFDGGQNNTVEVAFLKAEKMILAGVDIIDIGGYSSRPNAIDIAIEEEISRIEPVIRKIRHVYPSILLSVDTFRSQVAEVAIECGVDIINDITGGSFDKRMFEIVAKAQVVYCMMHMRGTPQTMMNHTNYDDVALEVIDFLAKQIKQARDIGVRDIIIDPGFGFAKTQSQNFELLKKINLLRIFEVPILVGVSRKSMIYKTLHTDSSKALNGSTVLHTIALQNGATILRVHDVKEVKEIIALLKNL